MEKIVQQKFQGYKLTFRGSSITLKIWKNSDFCFWNALMMLGLLVYHTQWYASFQLVHICHNPKSTILQQMHFVQGSYSGPARVSLRLSGQSFLCFSTIYSKYCSWDLSVVKWPHISWIRATPCSAWSFRAWTVPRASWKFFLFYQSSGSASRKSKLRSNIWKLVHDLAHTKSSRFFVCDSNLIYSYPLWFIFTVFLCHGCHHKPCGTPADLTDEQRQCNIFSF